MTCWGDVAFRSVFEILQKNTQDHESYMHDPSGCGHYEQKSNEESPDGVESRRREVRVILHPKHAHATTRA